MGLWQVEKTMSILYLEKCKASLLHAAFSVIVILTAMTIACGCKGQFKDAETEECERFSLAIQAAQDSGNYQRSLQLSKEIYDISLKNHSPKFRAFAAAQYGQTLIMTGQFEEGKQIVDDVMKFSADFSNDTVMGDIYDVYGLYEMVKGQNVYASTEYFLKSLGYARQRKDKLVLAGVLSNLVSSMTNQHDTTGLKYAFESYQTSKTIGKPYYQAYSLVNIIMQLKFRSQYTEAAQWIDTLRQFTSPAFMDVTANTLQADIYRETNDFEKANHYINLAVAMADTSKALQAMEKENAYMGKANLLCRQGKGAESNQWLDRLQELSRQSGFSMPKAEVARVYALNYEHLGDYKKALEYRNEQVDIMKDNTNSDRIKIQKAKEVALDIAQKDAQIEYHRDHAHLMEWLLWGAAAFIALLTALCLYIYNMYKRQRKLMTVVVERAQPGKDKEIEEENQKQMDDKHVELFRQIKEEIDDKKMFLDTNLSRESLAKHLGTNRTYISEAVSQMTGMNFPQYINLLRIKEAERRLHDPEVDVSNFANFGRTLGFASLNAFRTAFKQQTGMTLSAYREIARAKAG